MKPSSIFTALVLAWGPAFFADAQDSQCRNGSSLYAICSTKPAGWPGCEHCSPKSDVPTDPASLDRLVTVVLQGGVCPAGTPKAGQTVTGISAAASGRPLTSGYDGPKNLVIPAADASRFTACSGDPNSNYSHCRSNGFDLVTQDLVVGTLHGLPGTTILGMEIPGVAEGTPCRFDDIGQWMCSQEDPNNVSAAQGSVCVPNPCETSQGPGIYLNVLCGNPPSKNPKAHLPTVANRIACDGDNDTGSAYAYSSREDVCVGMGMANGKFFKACTAHPCPTIVHALYPNCKLRCEEVGDGYWLGTCVPSPTCRGTAGSMGQGSSCADGGADYPGQLDDQCTKVQAGAPDTIKNNIWGTQNWTPSYNSGTSAQSTASDGAPSRRTQPREVSRGRATPPASPEAASAVTPDDQQVAPAHERERMTPRLLR